MSEETELAAIARRYVDLWQDQLLAVASDPETVSALAKLMGFAGAGPDAQSARWRELWNIAAGTDQDSAAFGSGRTDQTGPSPLSTTVSDPSPDGGGDLAEFALRLAALEKRINTLETEPRPARRAAGRRRRKDSPS
jgi:hypothetical protein